MDTNFPFQDDEHKDKEIRKSKLFIIIAMFFLAFLFTGFHPAYLIVFWWFPSGLFYWLEFNAPFLLIVGWLIYFGLATTIIRYTNKNIVRILFIVLACLLIFNVHGCRVMDTNYWA